MALPILQTKLFIPRLRATLVSRTALLTRLLVDRLPPVTLVSAPAGFGKTTLVCEWINKIQNTNYELRDTQVSKGSDSGENITDEPTRVIRKSKMVNPGVAWLSLDDDDNDPTRFLSYLIAALQTVQPALGDSVQSLLSAPQTPPPKTILTLLLNELGTLTTPLTLVLDDYHLLLTPAIHEALAFFVDHLPPLFHLVITSRIDPPLPLARWRVRNQLTEIRAADLRFRPEEAATFLNEVMGLHLTTAEIATLETRTEGWIAGLQLAALSMQGRNDVNGFIKAFTGSHVYIVDYLAEEVLQRQSAGTQSFLLQTSILQRLCGALCDVVTDQTGSQLLLEKLQQSNLFITSLDDERRWFRYHHLFADVLRVQLQQAQPQVIPHLHQRASAWCEQHELWPEAIHHALAAADFARAARLIEQIGIALFAQPNIQHSLQRWLLTLPATFIRARPRLCVMYAWLRFAHGDNTSALQWVANAEATLLDYRTKLVDATSTDEVAAEVIAMRAVLSAYNFNIAPTEALAYSRQALAMLSEEQFNFRGMAASGMGMAYLKQGNVIGAEQAMTEANHLSRAASNPYMQVAFATSQVTMQRARGSWRRALETCHENLDWLRQHGAVDYPTLGSLYLTLADLLREQNELDSAQYYGETAIAHSDQELNPSVSIFSRLALMRVKQAQSDWPQVWILMDDVSRLIRQHPNMLHSTILPAITAQFQLAEGVIALETMWAKVQNAAWEEGPLLAAYRFIDFVYLYEHSRLARAQVFIAWARRINDHDLLRETLAYLQRQAQIAAENHLGWYLIKVQLLQALAHHTLGEGEAALVMLTDALRRAEPEGYVRIFVDEGEPLRLLILALRATIVDLGLISYINKLLTAFPHKGQSSDLIGPSVTLSLSHLVTSSLIEPLTDREREILRLVADGLSNSEIANKLIITVGTVKKHLNTIYGKLGVGTRTQAIARSRALEVL